MKTYAGRELQISKRKSSEKNSIYANGWKVLISAGAYK